MANESTERNWTPVIWVIGLIFICGMTYQSVGTVQEKVAVNTGDIKDNRSAITQNKILFIGLKTTLDGVKEDTADIKDEFKELKDYLMQYGYERKEK